MKNSMEAIKSAVKQYNEDEVKRIYVPATIEKKPTRLSEGVNGCSPRIEELIEFAKLVKAKTLGFQKKQAELWRFLKMLVSQWFLLGASVAPWTIPS
jgi:uncharacterized metal-binding protein